MRPETLGVIGLGAIGGSLAWQARKAGIRVLGWSPRPAARARAVQLGALDDAPARAEDVARCADVLVLAAPPSASEDLLARLGPLLARGSVATDVATIKRSIARRAEALHLEAQFAGSHPVVTTEGRGFEAARSGLFAGAVVYVCPSGDELTAAREVAHFWETVLGAAPVVLDSAQHDAQAAWTCHVPRVVAAALGTVLRESLPAGVSVGASLRYATREAAGPADESEALVGNADRLIEALDALSAELGVWRSLLAEGTRGPVAERLDRAAAWRRGIGD